MPALPEKNSLTDFGGAKVNYTNVVDSSTDWDASQVNGAFCDIAMASRMVDRGYVRFTAGASPSLTSWEAVWKGSTATLPVIAKTGTGVYTVTWPTTVLDELGASHTLNLGKARASFEGTTFGFSNASAAANIVTINLANSAGSADDMTGVTVLVEFGYQ